MIGAIVLAAGESRRMGTNKLLLPYGEGTVIGHILKTVLTSAIDRVYVVVGHEADRIEKELSVAPVTVVENPDYKKGMLESVRCGLRAMSPEIEAAALFLGDQPGISTDTIDYLIQSYRRSGKKIAVPVYGGLRGHPLLFSTSFSVEILENYDEVGLRGLLTAHPEEVEEVDVPTSSVLQDMDRIEDYRREGKHR